MAERPLKLAVIGDPVTHSASPRLHREFLRAAKIAGTYEAITVPRGTAAAAIDALRADGYTGLNVTTPLKEEAFARADERDAASLAAGSVNTLLLGERIEGWNTDGMGAIGALRAVGLHDLAGKRILVLGAGPTARSCIASFVASDALAFLWNRTRAVAEQVAAALDAHLWTAQEPTPDAVLSALPPGVVLEDPILIGALQAAPFVIDANYGERSTLARTLGRPVENGYEMLCASARASFAIFR
jgi:shikimate dehydrogenase